MNLAHFKTISYSIYYNFEFLSKLISLFGLIIQETATLVFYMKKINNSYTNECKREHNHSTHHLSQYPIT